MRRAYFFILVLFGMTAATFGQSTSPDSQTLQAVLTEVRGLRQDLQVAWAEYNAHRFCYLVYKSRMWPLRVRRSIQDIPCLHGVVSTFGA
jgi:hypothetical protein